MLLCAITGRILLADTETERAEKLVGLAALWAAAGMDFIQIRERDLADTELLQLSTRIVATARRSGSSTRVLINGKPARACTIALEAGADGVHFPGGLDPVQLTAAVAQIRQDWKSHQKCKDAPEISVSCHTVAEIVSARHAGATLALFAPVFEKPLRGAPAMIGQGLESLAEACAVAGRPGPQPELPVLALGGVTRDNAAECVAAGAAGIAAIRLFLNSRDFQDWNRLLLAQGLRQVPVPPQR